LQKLRYVKITPENTEQLLYHLFEEERSRNTSVGDFHVFLCEPFPADDCWIELKIHELRAFDHSLNISFCFNKSYDYLWAHIEREKVENKKPKCCTPVKPKVAYECVSWTTKITQEWTLDMHRIPPLSLIKP